jgi:ribosomal-protein-alanine N-acetyltransferase
MLRPFRPPDVDALYEIQGNREHMRFTFWAQSRDVSAAWLRQYEAARQSNGFAPWTAAREADQRIIGWGGLNVDPHSPGWGVEVTYFIHPACSGQGYATEIVRASLGHGFEKLGLRRIGAFARPANLASIRVLEKCGFKPIGYEPALERSRFELRRADWSAA